MNATGTPLVFVYCHGSGRRSERGDILSEAEGEAVAKAVSALPELLQGRKPGSAPEFLIKAPLNVEDQTSWFAITDARAFNVGTVYAGESRAGNLTWDQARRIASGIARLPDLLKPEEAMKGAKNMPLVHVKD